jgi:uncharacterized RDD family membrane protein YckC
MNEVNTKLASRWKRLGGSLMDGLISSVIIIPFMFITGVFQRALRGQEMTIEQHITLVIFSWVIFLILNGYLLANRGQTIGKVVVKTKIVDLDGNIPRFGKLLFLRYLVIGLVSQIPILGGVVGLVNALLIFGKERRCLHDYIASTRVVEA